jgi:Protein of unknown function (DUF1236)
MAVEAVGANSVRNRNGIIMMTRNILKSGALIICLVAPIGAHAQGIAAGAANGADQGNAAAGPVGAVVGGVLGGVTGGIDGLLGLNQRPRFREYVIAQHRASYVYADDMRVGAILPPDGVVYYDVPVEYGASGYRYTVVNNQTVLVDPRTHTIVQIVQ